MEFQNINPNETGLSVRTKLNSMLRELIEGGKGINNVWTNLVRFNSDLGSLRLSTDEKVEILSEQILAAIDHTDVVEQNLISYINAVGVGIFGFIDSPDDTPNVPDGKSVIVMASGKGTYVNFNGVDGSPITIDSDSTLIIFYRDDYSDYWIHQEIPLSINIKQGTGSSTTAVMSQKAVTDIVNTLTTQVQNSESDVEILNEKVQPVVVCAGVLEFGEIPSDNKVYLRKNAKGKIVEIISTDAAQTPVVGKLYKSGDIYYTYTGKEFVELDGGNRNLQDGLFNVTKRIPLSSRFHTLETAIEALRDADIENEDKLGMIITFESASGVWVDYRFAGTTIDTFYDASYWEEYGGKGAIKKITLTYGGKTEEVIPDKKGSINLETTVVRSMSESDFESLSVKDDNIVYMIFEE